MRKAGTTLALGAALAALVAVPASGAKPSGSHGHGNGHGPSKGVTYIFKGTYVDATTVDVAKGNAHTRKAGLDSGPVSFDLSAAKVSVADTNLDGVVDLADVAAGDKVVVKVRAPKGDPGAGPYAARQIVDQTHPADDAA